jgi:hypothetical protein
MLVRLLILTIAGVLIYRALKSWLSGGMNQRTNGQEAAGGQVDDVMIKDPVCGTYFSQRKGVSLMQGNQRLDFCSERCRDRYLAQASADHES